MITLYHGTYLEIKHPFVKVGRKKLDFGQGFYLTHIKKQAKEWAINVAMNKSLSAVAIINTYSFDKELALKDGYKLLKFEHYNKDWLDFVAQSRKGFCPWKNYDMIEGGIADDRVFLAVESYLNGLVDVETTLKKIVSLKPNHQICILNQEIINKYLYFVKSEIVK